MDLNKLKILFEFRRKEVMRFEHYAQAVKAFIQFCTLFKQHIDTSSYGQQIAQIDSLNINEFSLNSVCRCITIDNMTKAKLDKFIPDIYLFDKINHEDIATIDRINNLERLKCVLFDIHFNEACGEIKAQKRVNPLDIKHVIVDVFPLAVKKWKVIAEVIDRGIVIRFYIFILLLLFILNKKYRIYTIKNKSFLKN